MPLPSGLAQIVLPERTRATGFAVEVTLIVLLLADIQAVEAFVAIT